MRLKEPAMLAEIFLLRLENLLRETAKSQPRWPAHDPRFVPAASPQK